MIYLFIYLFKHDFVIHYYFFVIFVILIISGFD